MASGEFSGAEGKPQRTQLRIKLQKPCGSLEV